jgi:hypothetical protein
MAAWRGIKCGASSVRLASSFQTKGEIKNVITVIAVIAKTWHYWQEHLQSEVKTVMTWEARLMGVLNALGSKRRK